MSYATMEEFCILMKRNKSERLGLVHSPFALWIHSPCWFDECEDPKLCTIFLRGGSKHVLNQVKRNLQDAMQVVRNVIYNPKLFPGGGATEMALAVALQKQGQTLQGIQQGPFMAIGDAFEVIPCTLAQNCCVSVIENACMIL
jgi:chaperonin GroEL (HSP60 family)